MNITWICLLLHYPKIFERIRMIYRIMIAITKIMKVKFKHYKKMTLINY